MIKNVFMGLKTHKKDHKKRQVIPVEVINEIDFNEGEITKKNTDQN